MKRIKDSVVMKSLLGLMILLVLYSVVVAFIGFRGFTNALLEQYADGAFRTARTAAADVDANRIEEYRGSGGVSEEYLRVWSRLDDGRVVTRFASSWATPREHIDYLATLLK